MACASRSNVSAPTTPTCRNTPPPSTSTRKPTALGAPSCTCRNTPRRPPFPKADVRRRRNELLAAARDVFQVPAEQVALKSRERGKGAAQRGEVADRIGEGVDVGVVGGDQPGAVEVISSISEVVSVKLGSETPTSADHARPA